MGSATLSGWRFLAVWAICVAAGASAGFAIGWALWKLGLDILDSAIALVAAGAGGFIMFVAFVRWTERRHP